MKVFNLPDDRQNTRYNLVIFHYEKDNFEIIDNVQDADIISLAHYNDEESVTNQILELKKLPTHKNQVILILNVWTTIDGDGFPNSIQRFRDAGFNAFNIHSNHSIKNDSSQIYYDHMWNRQKAYFVDYDNYELSNRFWSFKATKKMYELAEISQRVLIKKFLIPNKTYTGEYGIDESQTPRSKYRVKLKQTILEHDCYFSDPENYIFLESQEMSNEIINDYHYYHAGMGFHPLADHYYQNSAVSVYVETLVHTESINKQLTEKTLNPLIKGHFILPFSYAGFVKDLRDIYGFKFPDWIDYSYDECRDNAERYQLFMKSFSKLRFKKLEELQKLCNKDLEILEYNRQLFYTKPYCSLYEGIKNSINNL